MKKEDATVPAEPAQPTEKAEKAAPAESPDQAEQAGQAVSGEQTDAEREKEREQERERFLDKVEKFALVLFVGLPCAIFLFLLGMETMYAAEHSGWQEALAFCGLSLAFFLSACGVVTLLGLAVERIASLLWTTLRLHTVFSVRGQKIATSICVALAQAALLYEAMALCQELDVLGLLCESPRDEDLPNALGLAETIITSLGILTFVSLSRGACKVAVCRIFNG